MNYDVFSYLIGFLCGCLFIFVRDVIILKTRKKPKGKFKSNKNAASQGVTFHCPECKESSTIEPFKLVTMTPDKTNKDGAVCYNCKAIYNGKCENGKFITDRKITAIIGNSIYKVNNKDPAT